MKIKKLWLVMLIAALLFSMMTFGCEEPDEWSPVTSLSQLSGKWKGSYSFSNSESLKKDDINDPNSFDATMTTTISYQITIDFNEKTTSGTMTMSTRFTGMEAADAYALAVLEMEEDSGFIRNDINYSFSMTQPMQAGTINEGDISGMEINQTGRKIRRFISEDDDGKKTYMILTKQ